MPAKHPRPRGAQWRRITIPIPPDLSARIDAAVHALPGETLTSLTRSAIRNEIDRLEAARGDGEAPVPFPAAPGRPPPGRPRKRVAPAAATAEPPVADASSEVERLLHVLEQGEGHEAHAAAAAGRSDGG